MREGHAVGQIATLPDAALDRLQGAAESTAPKGIIVDLAPIRDAVKTYDRPAIERILNRHTIVLPHDTLIFSVLLPILRDLGDRWESGAIRPAHEHLVSAAIRSVLGSLLRTLPNSPRARTLVLATPAGERHELGLLCAAVLAAARGLNVVYLGPDLPGSDIAHAAMSPSAHPVDRRDAGRDRQKYSRALRVQHMWNLAVARSAAFARRSAARPADRQPGRVPDLV